MKVTRREFFKMCGVATAAVTLLRPDELFGKAPVMDGKDWIEWELIIRHDAYQLATWCLDTGHGVQVTPTAELVVQLPAEHFPDGFLPYHPFKVALPYDGRTVSGEFVLTGATRRGQLWEVWGRLVDPTTLVFGV